MQENLQTMQAAALQPLVKLTQSNMELLTRFATSPEVMNQSIANAQNMFEQGQRSAVSLAQSGALAQLTQGILRNYIEFVTELSQGGMAALVNGQAEILRLAQDASTQAVQAAPIRQRR